MVLLKRNLAKRGVLSPVITISEKEIRAGIWHLVLWSYNTFERFVKLFTGIVKFKRGDVGR